MIVIGDILVSDNIVDKQFVCDLTKCKGGCCEEGDAGAPLEKEELAYIKENFEKVRPYLPESSLSEIDQKGYYVYDREFGWVTPTMGTNSGICVYALRDSNGVIRCAFEQAFSDGKTNWKKPISCHLFPIVAKKGKHGNYDMLNYQAREKLCSPACALGKKLKVPTYQFLKEAIIRKYGQEFYETLDQLAKEKDLAAVNA